MTRKRPLLHVSVARAQSHGPDALPIVSCSVCIMAAILKCNSCNTVVNELLTFVINKLNIMDDASMSRICLASYTTEDIKKAKNLLFQSVPSRKRKINRKNGGQERRDIDDIINLARVTDPEEFPVFVARDLHKLPPIDFDSVDLTSLLKDIVVLKNELQTIKSRYVTLEQLENVEKNLRVARDDHLYYRSVNHSNTRINVRRGAYLDSGPIGLSHVDLSSHGNEYSVKTNEKVPSHSSPCETNRSLSHSPSQQSIGKPTSSDPNSAAPAYAPSCPPRASSPPPPSPVSASGSPASKHIQRRSRKANRSRSRSLTQDQMANEPVVKDTDSFSETNHDKKKTTFAEVTKVGEWKTVQRRTKPFNANRFIGKMGKATTDASCPFKAADPNIPILITNVHKNTSQSEITEYIRQKTNENVTLEQIEMKDKNKYHNAYKFNVHRHKMELFLDERLWPTGIIFRRFVPSRYKKHVNINNSQSVATATSATSATRATTVSQM